MAEPRNNKLALEKLETRLYRVLMMQSNIDIHAVELGIAGPLLAWAQGCNTRFQDAITNANVEAGEANGSSCRWCDCSPPVPHRRSGRLQPWIPSA